MLRVDAPDEFIGAGPSALQASLVVLLECLHGSLSAGDVSHGMHWGISEGGSFQWLSNPLEGGAGKRARAFGGTSAALNRFLGHVTYIPPAEFAGTDEIRITAYQRENGSPASTMQLKSWNPTLPALNNSGAPIASFSGIPMANSPFGIPADSATTALASTALVRMRVSSQNTRPLAFHPCNASIPAQLPEGVAATLAELFPDTAVADCAEFSEAVASETGMVPQVGMMDLDASRVPNARMQVQGYLLHEAMPSSIRIRMSTELSAFEAGAVQSIIVGIPVTAEEAARPSFVRPSVQGSFSLSFNMSAFGGSASTTASISA